MPDTGEPTDRNGALTRSTPGRRRDRKTPGRRTTRRMARWRGTDTAERTIWAIWEHWATVARRATRTEGHYRENSRVRRRANSRNAVPIGTGMACATR